MDEGLDQARSNGKRYEAQLLAFDRYAPMRWPVVVDCDHPRRLYAGTSKSGVFRSDDAGQTWREINQGVICKEIWPLAQHPRTGELYVGTGPASADVGFYRSEDQGVTWRRLTGGLPAHIAAAPRSTAGDPESSDIIKPMDTPLVLGTEGGLWQQVGGTLAPVEAVPAREVTALARDGGRTWVLVDGRALWRRDAAEPWQEIASIDGPAATCLAVSAHAVLVGTEQARLLRFDNGTISRVESFERVEGRDKWYTPWGDPAAVRSIAIADDGTLHVNVHVGGVARSRDGGRSWAPTVDVEADVHQVLAHPSRSDVVLAAAYEGFGISRDGGDSWDFETDGMHAHYARAVAMSDDIVLVSASSGPGGRRSGLYRKPLESAAAFERCHQGLPWFSHNIDSGCLQAAGPIVVFGTEDGRVFRSVDHGQSWTLVTKGLPPVRCISLG